MSAWSLVYTRTAAKDVEKLDTVAKKKIKKKIEQFVKDPLHYAKKLTSSAIGSYRWRVGDFRIVFDIEGRNIVILRIGHRREIYR